MKIIYVTTESLMDHSFTIASELRKYIDLKTYIIAKENSKEIKDFCKKLGAVYIKRLRFSNPISPFREIKFLKSLDKQEYDLIWFNTLSVYQALFLKLFIKKFLVNTHDAELHPEEKDLHGIFSRWLTFKLYKKKVCLISKTQASVFEKRFGGKPKIFRLPIINYYEASAGNDSPEPAETGSKLASAPVSAVKFFFFGTILSYKGIELLLDAAEILEKNGTKYKLNIYGKIKYNEKNIIERIKKLNYIQLSNEFINYDAVYRTFISNDIIVLPYIHVTQCGPLLIAYNQNMPAICNNLPGFAEYLDDGKSGLLFNNSAEDLAEKMNTIINNPSLLGEMKKYIAGNIKSRFSMPALCPQYISNFESEKNNSNLS